jgi:hypothetical protein
MDRSYTGGMIESPSTLYILRQNTALPSRTAAARAAAEFEQFPRGNGAQRAHDGNELRRQMDPLGYGLR